MENHVNVLVWVHFILPTGHKFTRSEALFEYDWREFIAMPFQFEGFFIKWELKSYAKIRTWKIFMLHSNLGVEAQWPHS